VNDEPKRPEPRLYSSRAAEIVDTASVLLEADGLESLTMRRIASELGIKAPSIYKHFVDKRAVELAIIESVLFEAGDITHQAVKEASPHNRRQQIAALMMAYRAHAVAHPAHYRLATSGELARSDLVVGLEDWAGHPWYRVTGHPAQAQALWSSAHGMVILEIDQRYPPGSDLDATWDAAAAGFSISYDG
jgi:AcrR family transcriptional regulator